MFTTSCLLRDNSGKHTFTMVTCERIIISFFFIKGILFSKKINEIVGVKSDCCPNLVPLFSLTIFIQTFLHAISHSFNATEYFAHCAANNLCVFTRLRKRLLNISLETRNLKETESLERPYFSKLSPQDIKSVISKFPHLLKVQPWRDIKGLCAAFEVLNPGVI